MPSQKKLRASEVDTLDRQVDFWRDWAAGSPQDKRWSTIRFTSTIDRVKTPASMATSWPDFLFAYPMRHFSGIIDEALK